MTCLNLNQRPLEDFEAVYDIIVFMEEDNYSVSNFCNWVLGGTEGIIEGCEGCSWNELCDSVETTMKDTLEKKYSEYLI